MAEGGKENLDCQRIVEQFISQDNGELPKTLEDLKKFANAIGPSVMNSITKRELLSALDLKATNDGKKHLLARQTFESLVELGFDLASKDFVLIDQLNEVVLENYHHLFRSEEEVGAP